MGIEAVLAGTALIVSAIGTGHSIYEGERSATAQHRSQRQALAASRATAQSADEANNRANQKRPNANAILSAAQQAARGGMGGTMLTGPQGASSSELSLGKSTLLGG